MVLSVNITYYFQVMSILLTLLDRRMVTFVNLSIFIHEGQHNSDGTRFTLGETVYKSSNRLEIHVYLAHHLSDIHFLGTLLHELGHCLVDTFENGGHTEEWLQTTNKLMQVINHFIGEVPVLDSARHHLCAADEGPNCCETLTDSIIVLE